MEEQIPLRSTIGRSKLLRTGFAFTEEADFVVKGTYGFTIGRFHIKEEGSPVLAEFAGGQGKLAVASALYGA